MPVEIGRVAARAIRTDVGIDLLCDAADDDGARSGRSRPPARRRSPRRAAECLRVERGRPRYGIDLDDTVIPQEAGLNARAVSFTKGCYVGQETVARLYYRGKPNRQLRGLRLSAPARPGDQIEFDGRAVGRLGSVRAARRSSARSGSRWCAARRRPARASRSARRAAPAEVVELPFAR